MPRETRKGPEADSWIPRLRGQEDRMQNRQTFSIGYFLVTMALLMMLQYLIAPSVDQITYSEFKSALDKGRIESVLISDAMIRGEYKNDEGKEQSFSTVRIDDPDLVKQLEQKSVKFAGKYESPFLSAIISWVLPALVFVGIWLFAMRR